MRSWQSRGKWALLLLLAIVAYPAACLAADEVLKIGGLRGPVSLRTAADGSLVLLDGQGAERWLLRFAADGKRLAETKLPPQVNNAQTALLDDAGNAYVVADRKVWSVAKGADKADLLEDSGTSIAMRRDSGGETLCILQGKEIAAVALRDRSIKKIALSETPAKGNLSHLQARVDGHLYAYADEQRVIYHFDPAGKLLERFGSGGDLRCGIPAGHVGWAYDVDPQGNVYWSLADYGALLMYTADGKTGICYHGSEAWDKRWTGPIHTLTGFALSGDRAYVIDDGLKRITSFTKRTVAPGAADCDMVNTLTFGLSYDVRCEPPYKILTSAATTLKIAVAPGNRRLHEASLDYEIRDYDRTSVAKGTIAMKLPGSEGAAFDLPVNLPRLGWYQLDLALRGGGQLLAEQVHFLTRTESDSRLPIPEKEVSGWNDIATAKAIGIGLHRFAFGNIRELEKSLEDIESARKLGMPFFVQISSEKDCTPENVAYVLKQVPDLKMLEIVNEPNLRMSQADYVQLLKPCYEAAKRLKPDIIVLGPAQCGTALGWFETFFKEGGGAYVDGVSVHTYMRHNSMDACHWQWKLARLRQIMAANGCGQQGLYQTEHGFLGDFNRIALRHRWQARSVFLETMVCDRLGIGADRYCYYYVNAGGFGDFSSYLVDDRRELYPAASLLRMKAHFLGERRFAKALDFGEAGNWLVLGNLYAGSDDDLLILQNTGCYKPVGVELTLPAAAKAFDAFGNPLVLKPSGKGVTAAVDSAPTYIRLPHAAAFTAAIPGLTHNLAASARVEVDDAEAMKKASCLTNGALEFDFEDEPERDGFRAQAGHLPLDVTLALDHQQPLDRVVLFSSFADNDKCSPLEYDVLVRSKGQWKKVDSVQIACDGRAPLLEPQTKRLTWYENPWIFVHSFPTIQADAVRFHFVRTTCGAGIDRTIELRDLPERVHLREVQIFGPPSAEDK